MGDTLRLGRFELSIDAAVAAVETYTAPPVAGQHEVTAWQTYDRFAGGGPNELTDGELLTPLLLDVRLTPAAFIAMQQARPELEAALAGVRTDVPLADATADDIAAVARLFGVLDGARPHGLWVTTLSKVLHRKRPALVPLYDSFVKMAYVGSRLPRGSGRTWVEFVAQLLQEMKADLQAPGWRTAAAAAESPPALTPLRALSIVASSVAAEDGRRGR